MLALIEETREYVRTNNTTVSEVNVGEVVESILSFLKPLHRGLDFKTHVPSSVPPLQTQRIKLEQVLINLITNAADAYDSCETLPDGGKKKILITAGSRNGTVTLEVTDKAGGIPDEVSAQLFKAQVTTKSTRGGTGIGLQIAQNNVRALGGEISFNTEPGQGTTFTVRLPNTGPTTLGGGS
jgi:signal transduction histidine kinase